MLTRLSLLLLLALTISSSAYRLASPRHRATFKFRSGPLFSETSETIPSSSSPAPNTNIVPVDKENIENAAAVTGGILGLVLAGPVGAAVLAALTNYVVKKDNDSGEALRGLGKTVVEAYNFVSKMNAKYGISQKIGKQIGDAVDSVESDSETMESIKTTLGSAASKVDELNQEYDFVSKAKQVASSASVLSDAAVGKIDEANQKYDFIDLAKKAVNKAINKIREASNE